VTGETSTSAACGGQADERSTSRALLSRLGSPDVLLLAGGLVLPNLLSLATLISLLDIGLPPRTCAILLYASLAILARRIPFALTAALFLCLLAFDMVQTLSGAERMWLEGDPSDANDPKRTNSSRPRSLCSLKLNAKGTA
jgi:hypothetical protein